MVPYEIVSERLRSFHNRRLGAIPSAGICVTVYGSRTLSPDKLTDDLTDLAMHWWLIQIGSTNYRGHTG